MMMMTPSTTAMMMMMMTMYSVAANHLHNTGDTFLDTGPLLLCLQPCGKIITLTMIKNGVKTCFTLTRFSLLIF